MAWTRSRRSASDRGRRDTDSGRQMIVIGGVYGRPQRSLKQPRSLMSCCTDAVNSSSVAHPVFLGEGKI